MSLCHTIVINTKEKSYSAASPDELALVNAAKQFGVEFINIDSDDNFIISIDGKEKKYKRLSTCEFNSTRKRMSVIFQDPDGSIVLRCKGADSIISDRLDLNDDKMIGTRVANTKFVNEVAEEGLRTLFLAEKVLTKE